MIILTHDSALSGGVTPGLIIGREHSQVTSPYELRVVNVEDRAGGGQEFRVVDHLNGGI